MADSRDDQGMLTRRHFLGALGASAALAPQLAHAARQQGLNVLFLCSDEHNPQLLGHSTVATPHLDALRAESVDCAAAYVASPVCAPTRQSWLTGLHAPEHGQLANQYAFDARHETLVERFRDAGYATTCLGKLHTWSPEVDGALGFDRILNESSGDAWTQVKRAWRGSREQPEFDAQDAELYASMPFGRRFRGRVRPDVTTCASWLLTQEAKVALRSRGEKPFFLYLSLRMPHYPFDLPRPWYHLYDPSDMPGPTGDPAASRATRLQSKLHRWHDLTPAMHRLLQARYFAAVSYTDHLIGEVLAELDAQGLRQDTLVVYTSDHGDMTGERGVWLKHTMFDAAARKPLFFRMPGLDPAVYPHVVSEVDVLQTVAGLAGVRSDGPGQDLSASIRAGAAGRETAFATDYVQEDGAIGMAMARGARFKLTRYGAPTFQPGVELFDMEQDPGETVDLAEDPLYRPVVESLLGRLSEFESGLARPRFGHALRRGAA